MPRKKVKPNVQQELDKAQDKFDEFNKKSEDLRLNVVQDAPLEEREMQTKLSKNELKKAPDETLKPQRTIFPPRHPKTGEAEKFNEKFRKEYEFKKENVNFIAENEEIKGEAIELWTKPFAGVPAQFWRVPVNRPVWGPRFLAERIAECNYNVLTLEDKPVSEEGGVTFYGALQIKSKRKRLDAVPVRDNKYASKF